MTFICPVTVAPCPCLSQKLGLLALINEESHFPKATDDTLLGKLHIQHSVGHVTYPMTSSPLCTWAPIRKSPVGSMGSLGCVSQPLFYSTKFSSFLEDRVPSMPPSTRQSHRIASRSKPTAYSIPHSLNSRLAATISNVSAGGWGWNSAMRIWE